MNFDDFSSLSGFLTAIDGLDNNLVRFYFNLLTTNKVDLSPLLAAWHPIASMPPSEQGPAFEQAIRGVEALWTQAQKLTMLWYTGVWDLGCSGPARITRDPQNYSDNLLLVWVLSQAHPAGVTQGYGVWQFPPEES
jgi:hypothetical protein